MRLLGGSLRSATATLAGDQAVHPLQQEGMAPVGEAGGAEAPAGTEDLDRHVGHEQVDQPGGPPYPSHSIVLLGVLQTAVEVCDG